MNYHDRLNGPLQYNVLCNTIAGFHTSGAWVESVYYGINNTRPIYSERAHRALQNPKVSC